MSAMHTAVAATSLGHIGEIQVPTETPGEGEVLIKTAYAALIPADTYVVDFGLLVPEFPMIFGLNGSGTVAKVGPGVKNLKVGDRVAACVSGLNNSQRKTMQEYFVQSELVVSKIPDTLSLDAAATIPDNFITSFFTLFSLLELPIPSPFPPTELPPLSSAPILIYGASSTLGQYTVQLLRFAGYKNIIATASTKNHDYIRSLGATFTFDYKSPTLSDDIAKAVGADGKVLIAFDCIAAESTIQRVAQVISPSGKVAIILPIKMGDSVIISGPQEIYFALPKENNPFPEGTKTIYVRGFDYQKVENLNNNLMTKILPELLEKGFIQPNRMLLMDKGSLKERVGGGLELLSGRKISGEKVIVKISD